MSDLNLNSEDKSPEWAREVPRKRFSFPYTKLEILSWLKNNTFGPSHKFEDLTDFIPQKSVRNSIIPKIKLGFLGDIMRIKEKEFTIGENVIEFFKDIDFLVGNFEGTITDAKRSFMSQEHTERILSVLESLFPPEKFVLGCANNHSGDFGWTEFNKSYQLLKDRGFLAFGRRDEPAILLKDQVNIVCCTVWSNQKCAYIPYLKDAEEAFDKNAAFNVLFPHWGYEVQLYPNPKQIKLAKQLLGVWGLIVGHHSHCPQAITAYDIGNTNKVIAYSLGDFCTHLGIKKYRHGIIVKAELGPGGDDVWRVGEVDWKFTHVKKIDKNSRKIVLKDTCKYFKKKL